VSDVLVLCYHAVSPTWRATISVAPDTLERQLSLLVSRGWKGATFTDAVLSPPWPKTVAVTFDDGFASVSERAEPILSALGLPGTVFVPTAFMSGQRDLRWNGIEAWCDTPDAAELRCMGWDELRELADRGWEVGSHTRTHPRLTDLAEPELRSELRDSLEECSQQLRRRCRAVAYPYGAVNLGVAHMAADVGYLVGACLSHSLAAHGPHLWPRIGVFHNDFDWRFRLKVSRLTRSLRGTPLARTGWVQPLSAETHRST
jgi:peptidoglycan/xylan/chitin deacetylase (PgdA/CDA1 family)